MTIKGSRTKKRHGRPGVASPKASSKASRPRPEPGGSDLSDQAATSSEVKPDRDPARAWGVPAWLMLASAMWSATVVWQLFATADEVPLTADGGQPWLLILAAVVAALASGAAFWLLRSGSTQRVRALLILAALSGVFGIFSTVAALASLFMVRRRRS